MPPEAATPATPDSEPTATASAAAAPAAAPAAEAPAPEVQDGGDSKPPKDADLDAFRAGAAKVSANPEAVAPKPSTMEVMRDGSGRFVPKPGDKPADPAKPEDGKPAEGAAAAKLGDKPEAPTPDPKVEEEIKALGITNQKSQDRFRELSATEKEYAPIRAELKKAGITKAEDLPILIGTAGRAAEWEKAVRSTGASPEQFATTMQYTTLAVRANAGDVTAAKAAYQAASMEAAHWAKMLGMEAPGIDPLADHPDLSKEVEDGDLTRARALEIAQSRSQGKLAEQRARSMESRTTEDQAYNHAVDELKSLDAQLKSSDPHYAAKVPLLLPALEVIRANVHPSKWAAAVRNAYEKIPNPVVTTAPAPASRAPITPMPVRPTGGAAPMQRVPKDDLEAFRMGAASVR